MEERIRKAGAMAWAVCGIAALVVLIGLIAYVLRVIWPPLILAGAIVFLLNPLVTRLQRRHVPRALGTGLCYLGVVALTVLVVLLVAPLATRQYVRPARGGVAGAARRPGRGRQQPVGAVGGERVADPVPHVAGAGGPVLGGGGGRHQR
jgi:hypothetical protein